MWSDTKSHVDTFLEDSIRFGLSLRTLKNRESFDPRSIRNSIRLSFSRSNLDQISWGTTDRSQLFRLRSVFWKFFLVLVRSVISFLAWSVLVLGFMVHICTFQCILILSYPHVRNVIFGKTILTLTKALFRLVSVMWHDVPFRSPLPRMWIHFVQDDYPSPTPPSLKP